MLHFLLGVFAAIAKVDEEICGATSGSFGGDRAISAEAVAGVDDASVAMRRYGHAAADVAYDSRDVVFLVADFFEVPANHRSGVEGMEKHLSGEFREAENLTFGEHFVRSRRVCDICFAFTEAALDAFRLADTIDFVRYFSGDDGAEVAGVHAVSSGPKDFFHVIVDVVDAGYDWGYQASAGHDDVHIFFLNASFAQEVQDRFAAHGVLIHYVPEFFEFLRRMLNLLLKGQFSIYEEGDFGGDGACIYREDVSYHGYYYFHEARAG